MSGSLLTRFDGGVRRIPFWEFHTGVALLLITGLVHCAWLLIAPPLYYVQHDATLGDGSLVAVNFSTEWILVRVGVAIVGAGALLLRKSGIGLLLSVLCLLWAGCEYLRWYLLSRALVNTAVHITPELPEHAGPALFYGASNWNAAVLSIVAVLLVWELMIMWRSGAVR